MARLSEADIRAIRRLRETTRLSLRTIGDRFGVGPTHVERISNRISWKHLS
jgi:DNA-binding Lrp family transcriptional regulator